MKSFLIVLVLLVAGGVGLAFFREWLTVAPDPDDKSNVTSSADKMARAKSMDGAVVSASADKLMMTDKEGKEHGHALAGDVNVTCDGAACTLADLKAGMKIRVTMNDATPHAVSRIEALDKNPAFASNTHDGKVVSITGNQLVMTNMEGMGEHACTLTADAAVTCDGKICKASDLKAGMKVRVTSQNGDKHTATRIEALDKNPDFEKGA